MRPSMNKLSEKLRIVQETICGACERAERDPTEVKCIIVTKSATIEAIREVIDLGFLDLGENHVQQLKKVTSHIKELFIQEDHNGMPRIRWHMIGHLQRNKVKHVLPLASLIHSVDTLRLAEEISSCATKLNLQAKILLQVNTSNEPQKYGVPVGAATHLAEQIETLPNIELKGLMTMAPLTRNKDVVRACFMRAKDLFVEMRGENIVGDAFTELSMGMSSDYEIAIEEGATILRIGSAVFAG
jgi:pyridoxal phosphate enzyme (YggS family)